MLTRVYIRQVTHTAFSFLRDTVQAGTEQLESFRSTAKNTYPSATVFKSSEEIANQRASIDEQRRKEKEAGNEVSQ